MLEELLATFAHSKGLKKSATRRLSSDSGLEIHPVSPSNFLYTSQTDTKRLIWFRVHSFSEENLHRIVLAYISDFLLVGTSLQPHKLSVLTPRIKFASLDHSMWFHQPFNLDKWILLDAESQILKEGRCLVHGRFFTQEGSLIASCTQEALIQV